MSRALLRRSLPFLAAALAAGCSSGPRQEMSDWEKQHPELIARAEANPGAPPPPAFPRNENLIEFYVSANATFHYFIDASSLQALYDRREVRYVLVARSPSGIDNVSFEALRCPDVYRVFAVGSDGKWTQRSSDWQPTVRRSDLGAQSTLARQFFCPHNDPIQSAAEGVNALKSGGHPGVYVEQNNRGGGGY
jgi:hypothetical protein